MPAEATRSKNVDTSAFWRIIVPILVLVTLLVILFVIFAMPDWAIPCGDGQLAMRRLAASISET